MEFGFLAKKWSFLYIEGMANERGSRRVGVRSAAFRCDAKMLVTVQIQVD